MFSVKFFLISLTGLLISSEVFASRLVCNPGVKHRIFTATMDSTNYSDDKYFDLTNASIVFEYATASNMSCAGYNLDNEISCVGHWFGMVGSILEFNIKKVDDKLIGKIRNLKHRYGTNFRIGEGIEFECEVE